MRTPITYYGGKQLLASKIISMMPLLHSYFTIHICIVKIKEYFNS